MTDSWHTHLGAGKPHADSPNLRRPCKTFRRPKTINSSFQKSNFQCAEGLTRGKAVGTRGGTLGRVCIPSRAVVRNVTVARLWSRQEGRLNRRRDSYVIYTQEKL